MCASLQETPSPNSCWDRFLQRDEADLGNRNNFIQHFLLALTPYDVLTLFKHFLWFSTVWCNISWNQTHTFHSWVWAKPRHIQSPLDSHVRKSSFTPKIYTTLCELLFSLYCFMQLVGGWGLHQQFENICLMMGVLFWLAAGGTSVHYNIGRSLCKNLLCLDAHSIGEYGPLAFERLVYLKMHANVFLTINPSFPYQNSGFVNSHCKMFVSFLYEHVSKLH